MRVLISPGPFEEKRLIFLNASPFLRFFGELRDKIDSGEAFIGEGTGLNKSSVELSTLRSDNVDEFLGAALDRST
tara:strand:- start:199 stop:423 length:225 start_codon:yes stop_codon:yes gene_type:complete